MITRESNWASKKRILNGAREIGDDGISKKSPIRGGG